MKYPNFIKPGDTIGVTAPSAGITEKDFTRLNNVKNNFNKLGYKYIETENVRRSIKGRSADAKVRAEKFMQLWENDDVSAIIMATGGDFLAEILGFLDFDKISTGKLKWIQGYSNITVLSYIFTTMLDIATIYGPNIKAFGMENLYRNLIDSISLMEGKEIIQQSFEKCEDKDNYEEKANPLDGYKLSINTCWKSLKKEEKLNISGRCIGGCMDDIINLIGTKYDFTKQYINKYKDDGIVWFLEIYEMSTSQIFRNLLQMKNAGYFEKCKGIIFGRPLIIKEEYDMKFNDVLYEFFKDLNIPIIYDLDIGHVAPQMPIINGAILDVNYENGKGKIKHILK